MDYRLLCGVDEYEDITGGSDDEGVGDEGGCGALEEFMENMVGWDEWLEVDVPLLCVITEDDGVGPEGADEELGVLLVEPED